MKKMKHIMLFLLIGFAIPKIVWAQGTFPPLGDDFTVDFSGASLPPEITTAPSGTGFLSLLGFGNYGLGVTVLSPAEATNVWIVEMGIDNSLIPIFEYNNGSPYYLDSAYNYTEDWQVTDSQAESLLAGQWYVQMDFGTDILLGKITLVPEPSSAHLFLCGLGFFFFCCASFKVNQCWFWPKQ
jgi:hypothetical protein